MDTQGQAIANWEQVKGKIKQRWGELTDNELMEVEGNYDQLVGLVQQKSGEARHEIERFLNEIWEQSEGAFPGAAETVRRYAGQAGEMVRGAAEQVRHEAVERYGEAQVMVREHPGEAVAVAFGTGLILGVMIGIVVGSRD